MQTLDKLGPGVSVVVPVYNSGAGLPELVERIVRELEGRGDYEIIAVNDGSRDDSLAVLLKLASRYPRLRVIDLAKNAGQENAILAGFSILRYGYVVCMDDDLQHDPADIPRMLDVLIEKDLDIVFARFVQSGNAP